MSERWCVLLVIVLAGCGVESMQGSEATDDGTSSTESTSSSTPEVDPATDSEYEPEPDPESDPESDTGSDPESGTDDDTGHVLDDCHPMEATLVEHPAFSGAWCPGAPNASTVLTTQAEVNAHAATYCESCWRQKQPCPKGPNLKKDTAIIYAHTGTPLGALYLDILAVEDCGGAILIEGEAKMSCELALSSAWNAVVVPAFDKPVVFDLALPFPEECEGAKCFEDARECLGESDCPDGMTCITGCCASPR